MPIITKQNFEKGVILKFLMIRISSLLALIIFQMSFVSIAGTCQQHATSSLNDAGYRFDTTISRPVLENYLSRAITMQGLLTGQGNFQDNLRMIKHIGAKFIGRSVCQWGDEADLLKNFRKEKSLIPLVHQIDPDIILEACIFEIVTTQVNQISIPSWVFKAFGLSPEKRDFCYKEMLFKSGLFVNQWGKGASVPDVSQLETKLWFYFLGVSYINMGIEAIHFGQMELMDRNDPHLDNYWEVLSMLRSYAVVHARRHIVLCDAHVPSGGLVRNGKLLLDFHAFPLRIKEIPDSPEKAELKLGFSDGIYDRSKGGITYSGWKCEHLPYLVEFDNYGVSHHPGRPGGVGSGFDWIWGYDEITWFAHQSHAYRKSWLHYAWSWVRRTDTNGFVEMPGGRVLTSPLDDKHWYYANNPSSVVPDGYGDEETIRSIWANDPVR
jgi:hypothetical protein